MQEMLDVYFAKCDANKEYYRIEALALACGLAGRAGLDFYQARPEFEATVKSAKSKVRESYERLGMEAKNPAFAIFMLKNMGYSDQQQHQIGGALLLSDPGRKALPDDKLQALIDIATKAVTVNNEQ
jgi:regulator of sirC expression with transglutaminase-like and TPR domain